MAPVIAIGVFHPYFWTLLAAAAAIAVAAGFYLYKRRRFHALAHDEELALWNELAKAPAAQPRETIGGRAPEANKPVARADAVRSLFDTLRADRAHQTGTPAQARHHTDETAAPVPVGMQAGTTRTPLDPSRSDSGSFQQSRSDPSSATVLPSIPPLGSTQPWPESGPRDALGPADAWITNDPDTSLAEEDPWKRGPEDLPFQVRMDICDRLEADLEWVEARTQAVSSHWTPRLMARRRKEARVRDEERLTRQVGLAQALLRSPDVELRKKGVELADRLEVEFHERRAKQPKATHHR